MNQNNPVIHVEKFEMGTSLIHDFTRIKIFSGDMELQMLFSPAHLRELDKMLKIVLKDLDECLFAEPKKVKEK